MGNRPVSARAYRISDRRSSRDPAREIQAREPVLILAHHPTLLRIGETLLVARGVTAISRLSPSWSGGDGRVTGPLDDPSVSRTPFTVRRLGRDGVEIATPVST